MRFTDNGLPGDGVVARLMGAEGVQRVPSAKLGLFIARGALSPDLCATLIERIDLVRRPSTIADASGVAGNRTWTVMIYLNAPEAGGATRFKAIDKIIRPEIGKLIAWNNRRADGSPNPETLHQG